MVDEKVVIVNFKQNSNAIVTNKDGIMSEDDIEVYDSLGELKDKVVFDIGDKSYVVGKKTHSVLFDVFSDLNNVLVHSLEVNKRIEALDDSGLKEFNNTIDNICEFVKRGMVKRYD